MFRTLLLLLIGSVSIATAQVDFGDHASSTLTGKAWAALNAKRFDDAQTYAQKCVSLYEKQAADMQKSLAAPLPASDREAVFKLWALNEVGTCLFILGQALEKQDKPQEALAAYRRLTGSLPFAQAWDPQGWFWKPADAAKNRLKALEFDTLK